jgi:hypothetical protein
MESMTKTPTDPAALRARVAKIVRRLTREMAERANVADVEGFTIIPTQKGAAEIADAILALPEFTRATELAAEIGVCDGCGSSHRMEDLRAAGHISCCPERKMLTAKEWSVRAETAESRLLAETARADAAEEEVKASHEREIELETALSEIEQALTDLSEPEDYAPTILGRVRDWLLVNYHNRELAGRTLVAESRLTALTTAAREAEQALGPFAAMAGVYGPEGLNAQTPDDFRAYTQRLRTEQKRSGIREHVFVHLLAGHFRAVPAALTKLRDALGGAE